MDIATRLAVQAVSDAGLGKGDIDGLLTVTPIAEPSILWPTALCEALKLELSYFDSVDLGGRILGGNDLARSSGNSQRCMQSRAMRGQRRHVW